MTQRRSISEMQQKIVDKNLLDAVSQRDRDKIDLCLQKGADINAPLGWRSRPPLLLSAGYAHEDMVAFLLTKKPDLFAKDADGKTVFDIVNELQDGAAKKKINRMLLEALPDANPAVPAASAEESVTLKEEIPVLKPITLQPKKGGGSFQL